MNYDEKAKEIAVSKRAGAVLAALIKEERASAARAIGSLYLAIKREHWQKGPTDSEAIDAAHDWYYNTYGYDGRPELFFEIAVVRPAPQPDRDGWKP